MSYLVRVLFLHFECRNIHLGQTIQGCFLTVSTLQVYRPAFCALLCLLGT